MNNHQLVIRRSHRHNWSSDGEQLQLDASDGEDADDTLVSCSSQPVSTQTDHLYTSTNTTHGQLQPVSTQTHHLYTSTNTTHGQLQQSQPRQITCTHINQYNTWSAAAVSTQTHHLYTSTNTTHGQLQQSPPRQITCTHQPIQHMVSCSSLHPDISPVHTNQYNTWSVAAVSTQTHHLYTSTNTTHGQLQQSRPRHITCTHQPIQHMVSCSSLHPDRSPACANQYNALKWVTRSHVYFAWLLYAHYNQHQILHANCFIYFHIASGESGLWDTPWRCSSCSADSGGL